MKFYLFVSLVALTAAPLAMNAQESAKSTTHHLRILPVGPEPPMKVEVRNGQRHEIDPPSGSIPPDTVNISTGGGSLITNLHLGRCSQTLTLKVSEDRTALVTEEGETPSAESSWLKIPLTSDKRSLAILFRSHDAKNWDEPKLMVLPDGRTKFPAGSFRFINTAPLPILVKVGEGRPFILKPGRTHTIKAGKGTQISVAVQDEKKKTHKVARMTLSQTAGQRTNLVAYWAPSNQARVPPVKIRPLREDLPIDKRPDLATPSP